MNDNIIKLDPRTEIVAWEMNPRKHFDKKAQKKLLESVRLHGVLQPILVRKLACVEQWQVVCGERRWRAAVAAELESVLCVERELDDKAALELAVCENLERQDIDVVEEGQAYSDLVELGWGVKELADRFGFSRGYIDARMRLCDLSEAEMAAVRVGDISVKTAVTLLRVDDEERSVALAEIVKPSHSVGAMTQDRALSHIKRHYLEPRSERLAWEAREKKLMREYPGAVFLSWEDSDAAFAYDSDLVRAGGKPASYEVTEAWREDYENVPTWGKLGELYGAEVFLVAPDGRDDDPVLAVEKQPIIDADVSQAAVGKNVFPKPRSEAEARDEELENERRKAAAVQREKEGVVQLAEFLLELDGKDLSSALPVLVSSMRDDCDQHFQDVYNAVHFSDLSPYDDDDREKLDEWVDERLAGDGGVMRLLWLLVADEVVRQRGSGLDEWFASLGVDAGKFSQLVRES